MSRSTDTGLRNERAGQLDVVCRLEREWVALTRPLALRLREWGRSERALARFRSPQQLIRVLRSPAEWTEKDAALIALLRLARVDSFAGRVVLEAVLPGLKRLAQRLILDSRDREELWQLLLAHAWLRIRNYPLERRPSRVAANLLLDTKRAALTELGRDRRHRSELAGEPVEARTAPDRPESDVEELLARAVSAGALTREEAELILRTRLDGVSLAALAAQTGVLENTLNVRRLRAERRLLLFLGRPAVRKQGRNVHCIDARAAGDGLTGSAGGGAVTRTDQRR